MPDRDGKNFYPFNASLSNNSKSTGDIAERLYLEQRPTPSVWKKYKLDAGKDAAFHCVWQKSVILKILRDEQYLGIYTAGKTKTQEIGHSNRDTVAQEDWIRIPDHHPAIISQELFERVQRLLHVKGDPLRKGKRNAAGIEICVMDRIAAQG